MLSTRSRSWEPAGGGRPARHHRGPGSAAEAQVMGHHHDYLRSYLVSRAFYQRRRHQGKRLGPGRPRPDLPSLDTPHRGTLGSSARLKKF